MGNCMLQLDRDAEVHLDAIDRDIEQEPKKFIKEHKIFLLGKWSFNGHFVCWWEKGSWWGKWHKLYTIGIDSDTWVRVENEPSTTMPYLRDDGSEFLVHP